MFCRTSVTVSQGTTFLILCANSASVSSQWANIVVHVQLGFSSVNSWICAGAHQTSNFRVQSASLVHNFHSETAHSKIAFVTLHFHKLLVENVFAQQGKFIWQKFKSVKFVHHTAIKKKMIAFAIYHTKFSLWTVSNVSALHSTSWTMMFAFYALGELYKYKMYAIAHLTGKELQHF